MHRGPYGRNLQPSYARQEAPPPQQQLLLVRSLIPDLLNWPNKPIGFLPTSPSNPSGLPFSLLHAFSFSIYWKSVTTFLRQLIPPLASPNCSPRLGKRHSVLSNLLLHLHVPKRQAQHQNLQLFRLRCESEQHGKYIVHTLHHHHYYTRSTQQSGVTWT